MTIDEAIRYHIAAFENLTQPMAERSEIKCDEEHLQLVYWLKELKELREKTQWVPCNESMPEVGTSVIIYATGHRVSAYYDAVKGVFRLTESEDLFYAKSAVTHWMPMPEPPEETNKDE